MRAHAHEADGKQDEHKAGDQVGSRHADAVAEQHAERTVADDCRERRRRSDDQEEDIKSPQRAFGRSNS
jgi:hypothetical protein